MKSLGPLTTGSHERDVMVPIRAADSGPGWFGTKRWRGYRPVPGDRRGKSHFVITVSPGQRIPDQHVEYVPADARKLVNR